MSAKINLKKIPAAVYALCSFGYIAANYASFNMSNFGNFALLSAVGFYCLMSDKTPKKTETANNVLVWIMAFLFSAASVLGYHFTYETVITLKVLVMFVFCIGGFTIIFKYLFVWLYCLVENWAEKEKTQNTGFTGAQKRKAWLSAFVIIMLCWCVVWLAYYPGFINYDHEQIQQVLTGQYTTHHPLIHTLIFGGLYAAGVQLGNAYIGVIMYAFMQMSIMAAIFSYAYVYIKERTQKKAFHIVTLVFFAVFPVNSILALSTTKDVLFSGLVLLCLLLALKCLEGQGTKWHLTALIVAAIFMLLFRNNAIYAFVLMLAVAVLLIKAHKKSVKIILCMLLCIVVYKGCDSVLVNTLNPAEGSIAEMLSLPSQQFGRIYLLAEENGDEDTMQLIEEFYDTEKMVYKPYISDLMKYYFIDIDNSEVLVKYLKTSVELFKRYPMATVQAVIYITQGHWDINDISHAEIYGTLESDRFGYLATRVYEGYGVETQSKIPFLERFFENAFTFNKYQNLPVITLLFAPAFYLWFLFFYTLAMLKAKNWTNLLLCSFFWFYILTLFAGPCVLIRYIYPLIISTPVLICTMVNSISKKRTENNNG